MPRTTIRNSLAVVAITLLACTAPVLSEETHTHDGGAAMKPPARTPFLVAGKMPHLTGVLKQHWDDPDLKLTPEQKVVLLEIRKNTMSAVMDLAEAGIIARGTGHGRHPARQTGPTRRQDQRPQDRGHHGPPEVHSRHHGDPRRLAADHSPGHVGDTIGAIRTYTV